MSKIGKVKIAGKQQVSKEKFQSLWEHLQTNHYMAKSRGVTRLKKMGGTGTRCCYTQGHTCQNL